VEVELEALAEALASVESEVSVWEVAVAAAAVEARQQNY
jgi:hypothetical protein